MEAAALGIMLQRGQCFCVACSQCVITVININIARD